MRNSLEHPHDVEQKTTYHDAVAITDSGTSAKHLQKKHETTLASLPSAQAILVLTP